MKTIMTAALLLGSMALCGAAQASELFDSCMKAKDPTYTGEQAKTACTCAVAAIGDDQALAKEAIALGNMTKDQRSAANSSEKMKAVQAKCFPDAKH